MSAERDIQAALRALAEADRVVEAPPELEGRLRLAFRRNRRQRVVRRVVAWSAGIAAVLVAMVIAYDRSQSTKQTVPIERVRAEAGWGPAPLSGATSFEASAAARPQIARVRHEPQPREIFTEFFPLLDAAPPVDRGELVRVNLPAAAMQSVGLPVREDRLQERVQADVLVSEEGLATAIRFVKANQ